MTLLAQDARPRARHDRSAMPQLWYPLLLLGCILVSAALVIIATGGDIGFSPDSVAYARSGLGFRDSHSFEFLDGSTFTIFPLATSATVALLGVGHTLLVFNLCLLALHLLVIARLALEVSGSRVVALVTTGWVSITISTTLIHSMLWSESLFNLCVDVALLQLVVIAKHRSISHWAGATLAIVVTLAGMSRYAVVPLLLLVAVVLGVVASRSDRREWVRAGITFVACCAGIAVTVVRNLLLAAEPFGPRGPTTRELSDVLFHIGTATANLISNQALPIGPLLSSIGWALIGVLALVGVHAVRSGRVQAAVLVLVGWFVIYVGFISASELTTSIDAIDVRISSPLQTVSILLVVQTGRRLLRSIPRQVAYATAFTGLTVAMVLALSFAWATSHTTLNLYADESPHWVAAVKRLPSGAGVVSNHPFSVSWTADRTTVMPTPEKFFFTTAGRPERLADIRAFVEARDSYLVWFGYDPTTVVGELRQSGFSVVPGEGGNGYFIYALASP